MQVGILGVLVHTIRSPLEGPPPVPVGGAVHTPAARDRFLLVALQTGWSPAVEQTITVINSMNYRAFVIFITMLKFRIPTCAHIAVTALVQKKCIPHVHFRTKVFTGCL